jgi:glycosyltransferase involved in cell wall biosynthesis
MPVSFARNEQRGHEPRADRGPAAPGNALSIGVNLAPQSGGTFRTVRGFYDALSSKGWTAHILNFSKYDGNNLPEGSWTFPTSRLPVGRAYQWCAQAYGDTVTSAISRAGLVFIHGVYVHPLLQAAMVARRHGVPYVLVPHGSLDPFAFTRRGRRKKIWLSVYREVLFERSAAVLYASEAERNRSWAAGLERRVECIPWTVTTDSIGQKDMAREAIGQRHGLVRDRRIALFCARIATVKRVTDTIRAFLREAPSEWVLLCVGPATSEVDIGEIRTLCAQSDGRCIYAGPVFGAEVKDYYAAADLFVLLSLSENFGHSAGEALALATPVALSPGVGLAEYVLRYGGGFVAGGESFEDMCRVLSTALSCSADALRGAGEAGREWVKRELNPTIFAERLDALCRSVCGEARAASGRCAEAVAT